MSYSLRHSPHFLESASRKYAPVGYTEGVDDVGLSARFGIDERWAGDLEYDFLAELDYSSQNTFAKTVFPFGTR